MIQHLGHLGEIGHRLNIDSLVTRVFRVGSAA